jgi:hypothetical protein
MLPFKITRQHARLVQISGLLLSFKIIGCPQLIHSNSQLINAEIHGFEFDIHRTLYQPAFQAKKEWG